VVGFIIGSREKVPGKTCERRIKNNNNTKNNNNKESNDEYAEERPMPTYHLI
jgi:hypothetical protein